MSILLYTEPHDGHVYPMRVLVRALVNQGFDVIWTTGKYYRSFATEAGARFYPITEKWRKREGAALRSMLSAGRWTMENFVWNSGVRIEGLQEIFANNTIDLLISDPSCIAALYLRYSDGKLTHGQRFKWIVVGIFPILGGKSAPLPVFGFRPSPNVFSSLGHRLARKALERLMSGPAVAELKKIERDFDLSLPKSRSLLDMLLDHSDLYFQCTIPEFEFNGAGAKNLEFGGCLPIEQNTGRKFRGIRKWMAGQERFVFVSQGTVATDPSALLGPCIAALADSDLAVLCVGRPPEIDPFPDNVKVVPFAPYDEVLSKAACFITNGGYGGLQSAIRHGVPVIAAGRSEEKLDNGARVAYSGLGISLRTATPSPEEIQKAVDRIFGGGQFKESAARLGRQAESYDAVSEFVQRVSEMTGKESPHSNDSDDTTQSQT